MLSQAIMRIEAQRGEFKAHSLEDGVAQVLIELCRQSPATATAIAATDKTIKDCAKALSDYAQKHKSGNSYWMGPDVAAEQIRKFYGITDAEGAPTPAAPTSSKPSSGPINILDML